VRIEIRVERDDAGAAIGAGDRFCSIMGGDVMDTLKNLQKIIKAGMPAMDSTIVEVMEAKRVQGNIEPNETQET
jgi:hypothetical protein